MKIKDKVLIVEDEQSISSFISMILTANGYDTIIVNTGEEALTMISSHCPDLIVLDLGLPDMDGLEVLRSVRKWSSLPIVVVSARNHERDKVEALDLGANDYITKPFSLSVLRARVNTQLRKQASNHKNAPFHMDLFHFDFEAMTFYVGDSKVELSKTEQKLLRLLVENRGRTMTRGDLVDRIWTDGAEYVDENALSVTIKRLRDKLGAQKYIKTVYGIGYSWVTKDE